MERFEANRVKINQGQLLSVDVLLSLENDLDYNMSDLMYTSVPKSGRYFI